MIETKSNPAFKRLLLAFISLVLVAACVLGAKTALTGESQLLAGTRPTNTGVHAGGLVTCPSTSNCVNSQSQDVVHRIAPLTYHDSPQEAMANLKTALQSFRRAKVITETDNYLYAEFTIPIVGFVNDVEFLLSADDKAIHVRSASRLGESDLGVNRRRIETLRAKLGELESDTSSRPA